MKRLFRLAGTGVLVATALLAQQNPSGQIYLNRGVPSVIRGLLTEHGDRLEKSGNERVTFSGTFTDKGGGKGANLTLEIPSSVRLQVQGGKVLTYNGSSKGSDGNNQVSSDEEDVLESLQHDSPESFFYSFGTTASTRLLGKRFRTDDGKNKAYAGPWYDIYELTAPVAVKTGTPAQTKLYYFDSLSQRFVKSRYRIVRGGKTVEVETVYSGWQKVNGQAIPGKIERFEDGKSVFSFAASVSLVGGKADDGAFGK